MVDNISPRFSMQSDDDAGFDFEDHMNQIRAVFEQIQSKTKKPGISYV